MARKHRLLWNESSDSGSETPARKRRARKVVQPAQKAEVTIVAADPATVDQNSTSQSDVEERILERIRKCLAKANHPDTPETEAKAAFRIASALMAQHNITQAQAFEKDKENDQARLGGESIVAITAANEERKVLHLAFSHRLADAMDIFFDCKSYSTRFDASIEWTFYGIATNTAAAAMGFEMAYNLILSWGALKKGGSPRHSYCLGVAEGLIAIAETEKEEEEEKAKESEMSNILAAENLAQTQRAREIDRLNFQDPKEEEKDDVPDSEPDPSDDESPENVDSVNLKIEEEDESRFETGADFEDGPVETDFLGDFKTELEKNRAREVTPPIKTWESEINLKVEEEDERRFETGADFKEGSGGTDSLGNFKTELDKNHARDITPPIKTWESEMQLTLFRARAQAIADEYLKRNNIKLVQSGRASPAKDFAAYRQGKKDSRKVDVRRKRLEAASKESDP